MTDLPLPRVGRDQGCGGLPLLQATLKFNRLDVVNTIDVRNDDRRKSAQAMPFDGCGILARFKRASIFRASAEPAPGMPARSSAEPAPVFGLELIVTRSVLRESSGFLRRVQHPKCIGAGGSLAVANGCICRLLATRSRRSEGHFPPDPAVRPGRPNAGFTPHCRRSDACRLTSQIESKRPFIGKIQCWGSCQPSRHRGVTSYDEIGGIHAPTAADNA